MTDVAAYALSPSSVERRRLAHISSNVDQVKGLLSRRSAKASAMQRELRRNQEIESMGGHAHLSINPSPKKQSMRAAIYREMLCVYRCPAWLLQCLSRVCPRRAVAQMAAQRRFAIRYGDTAGLAKAMDGDARAADLHRHLFSDDGGERTIAYPSVTRAPDQRSLHETPGSDSEGPSSASGDSTTEGLQQEEDFQEVETTYGQGLARWQSEGRVGETADAETLGHHPGTAADAMPLDLDRVRRFLRSEVEDDALSASRDLARAQRLESHRATDNVDGPPPSADDKILPGGLSRNTFEWAAMHAAARGQGFAHTVARQQRAAAEAKRSPRSTPKQQMSDGHAPPSVPPPTDHDLREAMAEVQAAEEEHDSPSVPRHWSTAPSDRSALAPPPVVTTPQPTASDAAALAPESDAASRSQSNNARPMPREAVGDLATLRSVLGKLSAGVAELDGEVVEGNPAPAQPEVGHSFSECGTTLVSLVVRLTDHLRKSKLEVAAQQAAREAAERLLVSQQQRCQQLEER